MTGTAFASAASVHLGHEFWRGNLAHWIVTKGLHIVLVVAFAIIATRVIRWLAAGISRRLARTGDSDALVRSEAVKHGQAVASVISSLAIGLLYVMVAVDVTDQLGLPVGSLVAPAAVLGAALGFGAQRVVQDLLSGFFVITEKQYGFGDLVELTVTGGGTASGTVEDVTLRVTRLRTGDGEVYTVPNGQIVTALNRSKDWARAVVDIPVPTSADINRVNAVLRAVATTAMRDDSLPNLLLDEPQLMGVESITADTVNLRMVARTLPGKQFEVGRRLRALIISAADRAGVDTWGANVSTVAAVASNAGSG